MKIYEQLSATEFAQIIADRLNTLCIQYRTLVLQNVKGCDMNAARYNLGIHDAARGLMEFIEKEVPDGENTETR